MIVLLATLLLAQAGAGQERKEVPMPDTAHPAANEHGATLGHQEAAPGAERKGEHGKGGEEHKGGIAEHIFEHVEDEVVVPLGFWAGHRYIRLDITKHVINMWIAAGILLIVVGLGARKRAVIPSGGYNLLPIPAYHGFPGVSTATGNVSVTMVLALFTFVLTQVAGMRAQGAIGYWTHLVPSGVPAALWPLMFVIEFFGLFTKPFALTVRLFANMVAGHIVIFFLIALTLFISVYVAPVSVAFALGIFMLELFVALVQAYVFTMLSALFIGMTQHAH
ncbi:MAG: F0F1 ATP synthase subunit A [Deltaproteobacteria bacterium]|nr:MAG: F0F1 ATP synthase subunit A [Deltaproteobacteria bacterium]